jgi:rod shape-determining protein MreC
LDIPFLPTSVDIKVGDKLVTSGIDGVYPAGLAVAKVTHMRKILTRLLQNYQHANCRRRQSLQLLILSLPEPLSLPPNADHAEKAKERTQANGS